jgi:serpin B
MGRRLLVVEALAGLLALAGCKGGTSAVLAGDGGSQAPLAQADVARDPASAIPSGSLSAAAAANNAFAVDLYSRVVVNAGASNLLTSPLSASLALTMTYAGAAGATATQMAAALHVPQDAGASIFDGQNALGQALASRGQAAWREQTQNGLPDASPSDYELQVVNSVWGEKTYAWAAPFLTTLAKSYGTGVYLEDFIHEWDPARVAINDWVAEETDEKIQNLLPAGALDQTTRMVLVDALHLRFPWASPFDPNNMTTSTFTRADGSTVSSSFMNETATLPYVDDGQAQIVELPFVNTQVAVEIALPHPDANLAAYEAGLAVGSAPLAFPPSNARVTLSLPKVAFTSPTFSLVTALKAMGMVDAFDRAAADLTGMCPEPAGWRKPVRVGRSSENHGLDAGDRGRGRRGRRGDRERRPCHHHAAALGHDERQPTLSRGDRRLTDRSDLVSGAHRGPERRGQSLGIRRVFGGNVPRAAHQTSQRLSFGRTIGEPSLHEKAAANSGRFESGPRTRYFGGECGFVEARRRSASGR